MQPQPIELLKLPYGLYFPLLRAGVGTIDQLRQAIDEGRKLPRFGPSRRQRLEAALKEFLSHPSR